MKKIKTFVITLIVLVAIAGTGAGGYLYMQREAPSPFTLRVIEVEGGYGYTVYYGEEEVIWQPMIPVIQGIVPFQTANEAKKLGQLVVKRLEQDGDPTVSKEDLLKLKIHW